MIINISKIKLICIRNIKKYYLIKNIIKYINSDNNLKGRRRKYNFHYQDIFNHPNRKYKICL